MLTLSAASGMVAAADVVSDGRDQITVEALRHVLSDAPPGVREKMSAEQMRMFIENHLTDSRLEAAAKKAGVDQSRDVRFRIEKARKEIILKTYLEAEKQKVAATLPDVTPIAREHYERDKAKYVVPEAVRVAHILIREDEEKGIDAAAAKKKAEDLLAQLRAGADFAKLARENSSDRSALNGGELQGWVPRGKTVKSFERAAFALKAGEISDVVRTQFGYHILKLIERRDSSTQTFEQVQEQIASGIRNELLKDKWEEWMKQFKSPERVQIDEETLEKLRKP